MFYNLYSPISYNTNFESVLAHYGFGFCGGNCNPFASMFNGFSPYNRIANLFPTLYPTACPDSFNLGNPYNFFNLGSGNNFGGIAGNTPSFFGQLYQYSQNPFNAADEITNFNTKTQEKTTPAKRPGLSTSTTPAKTTAAKTASDSSKSSENLGNDFLNTAYKYSNCNESDGSQRKFCINDTCKIKDSNDQEWCADFVTYVVKETYRKNGKTPPEGFGNHDVSEMKNWAILKNKFIRTSNKPQKGRFIAQNIQPGDIIILNENGASHTGFVTKVDVDGTVHTIEGNRDDRVSKFSYSPNYPKISGFIRLS